MTGASSDPYRGYAWDGDQRWTPTLVRQWWRDRTDQQPAADLVITRVAGPQAELSLAGYTEADRTRTRTIVNSWLEYRRVGLEHDLQRYVFFLEQGRYPMADDPLPSLS